MFFFFFLSFQRYNSISACVVCMCVCVCVWVWEWEISNNWPVYIFYYVIVFLFHHFVEPIVIYHLWQSTFPSSRGWPLPLFSSCIFSPSLYSTHRCYTYSHDHSPIRFVFFFFSVLILFLVLSLHSARGGELSPIKAFPTISMIKRSICLRPRTTR